MKICIIGLGLVGLSLATTFAERGFKVIGIEKNEEKYKQIKNGVAPFFEPLVSEQLKKNLNKNLEIVNDIEYGFCNSDVIFICVGTPSKDDGSVNLSSVEEVSNHLAGFLKNKSAKYPVIVIKSTVQPGTTERIKKILEENSSKHEGKHFGICMNPEFLREGSAVNDLLFPHLTVIGTNDNKTRDIMHELYHKFYQDSKINILDTNPINAELIKYANNAFLATKISFINTIANICNKIPGSNVDIIAKAIGTDPRIGYDFLKAGPGYGGSCFPKDVKGFVSFSRSIGYEPILLQSTNLVNQQQPMIIVDIIKNKFGDISGKIISILGVSFKKGTDDIRDSSSLQIIQSLIEKGVIVKVHDPMALKNLKTVFENKIIYCTNIIECLKDSICCLILTDWDEYKTLDEYIFKNNMQKPCIIDTKRLLNYNDFVNLDYIAVGIGEK